MEIVRAVTAWRALEVEDWIVKLYTFKLLLEEGRKLHLPVLVVPTQQLQNKVLIRRIRIAAGLDR